MSATFAVLWWFCEKSHAGALELSRGHLTLTGRDQMLSVPVKKISASAIERGTTARIHGMSPLKVLLDDGEVLLIASLAGIGSLQEIMALIDSERAHVVGGNGT